MAQKTLFAALALALAACGGQSPAAGSSEHEARPASSASAPAAVPAAARDETIETDTYSFSYAYPAAAVAIPGVKAVLDEDMARRRKELAKWAREGKAASKDNDYPFNPYDYEMAWDVVTDLPAWLSLSAAFSTYTGGAHPNHGFDALLWDKRAGKLREPTELFRSSRAFVDAVRADFCKALDKERAERREGESFDGFDECIDPTEAVIILGSSNGKAFDRVGFLIAPYIAGPYVEGSYEVTLPITPTLLAQVKPQYRASFSVMN